jgi:hypothetical protein
VERIGPALPDLDRLVDEVVGFRYLLGDGVDGVLEDFAFWASHRAAQLLVRSTPRPLDPS